jgi:hypothetical protein
LLIDMGSSTMAGDTIEQALLHRHANEVPQLRARSPGWRDDWLEELVQIVTGFGERPPGIACPAAIFAQPLGRRHVAVVQAADQAGALGFHVLVLPRSAYAGDPFALADRFAPPWQQEAGELPALPLPAEPLPRRTVEQVRQVLKRVKAGALREDEDPEKVTLTEDNAESPALLGGVQVLVDGGRLVFERRTPDPELVRGLWQLLPTTTRCELWPATFAFSNALGFDALVVPRLGGDDYAGYTNEEQAANYPQGRYELSLQTAAEDGDQLALDQLFGRRSSSDTLRLALLLVLLVSGAVLLSRWFVPDGTPPVSNSPPAAVRLSPEQRERAANAAAVVASHDPWSAAAWLHAGEYRRAERVATAAGMAACGDPWSVLVHLEAAKARYAEVWKPAK